MHEEQALAESPQRSSAEFVRTGQALADGVIEIRIAGGQGTVPKGSVPVDVVSSVQIVVPAPGVSPS